MADTPASALLGNCIAASFVAVADRHGALLITETQEQQQTLLTRSQARRLSLVGT
jgi:hypothetical protein